MRVRSSTIESHHFAVVRRRGYDPAEVDAAMGRLADTLREYEAVTEQLEVKLREADESSEAIHRTFVAAQRTRDEMIDEATKNADGLTHSARSRADEIVAETEVQVEAMLTKAVADADERYAAAADLRGQAEADAAQVRTEANEILDIAKAKAESARAQADEVLTSAIAEAEAKTEEANRVLSTHRSEAEATLREAQDEASRLTTDAATQAEQLGATATSDAAETMAASRREAEALISSAVTETKNLRSRVKAEIDELRTTRRAEAEALVTVAANEGEEIRSKAIAESETIVSQANARAEELLGKAKGDAAERITAAQSQSDEILDHAQSRAEDIVEEARGDKEQLERRAAQLRTAVGDIERELRKLAETTLERTGMIGEMIDLEHRTIDLTDLAPQAEPEPVPAAGAPDGESTDHPVPSPETTSPETTSPETTPPEPPAAVPAKAMAPATVPVETTEIDTVGGPVGVATVIESANSFESVTRRRSELEALARLVRARTAAFAEPDGSGRPPADRRLLDPEGARQESEMGETIYQRRTRGLRARLREEGQDPTQRGR